MTRGGMREYLDAIRPRYISAGRREKGRILDEAVSLTGQHRKALIRSLESRPPVVSQSKAGRPKRFGLEAATVLKTLWEANDWVCQAAATLPARVAGGLGTSRGTGPGTGN